MPRADLVRLTPMTVVDDVERAAAPLLALGATRAPSGRPDCLGIRTGSTAAIFVTADHLDADFGPGFSRLLEGRSILYAQVVDAEAAATRFLGRRLASAATRGGTREIVCEGDGHVVVFAEKVSD